MNPTTGPAPKEFTSLGRSMTPAALTFGTKAPCVGAGSRFPVLEKSGFESCNPSTQDRAFIAMLDAYRPYGGLSRLHGLTAGGRVESDGRESVVGKLVDEGALFGFHWNEDVWIPMFQFDMPGPKVAPGPQRVAAELGRGFDGWGIASWFVQPNASLESHSPIECLSSSLHGVLEAARAVGIEWRKPA